MLSLQQIGPGIQRQLQAYSDLDGPRRLIASLSDPADLAGFWVTYLSKHAVGPGARCLMIGSMGGVAAFHVRDPAARVLVCERYAWVGHIVRGVVGKTNMLRTKAKAAGGEEGGRPVLVSKKRPLELLEPAKGVAGEGEEEMGPFDAVYWLDWDFSLLGTGVIKLLRPLRLKEELLGKGAIRPMRVVVFAQGIQIVLPLVSGGTGEEGREEGERAERLGGLERMLWEVGPARMELPTNAYR